MADSPRHTPTRPPTVAYRPDIDGLRALAVLAVVGFHAFPRLFPGGFFGVDVFFVISGYLITLLMLEEHRRGTFSIATFYRRRVRRIVPALVLVLVTCLGFGCLALLPDEFASLGHQTAAAALFLSNFALWAQVPYFAPSAQAQPLLHLWSLGIEEQFYVAWPLLVMLLWRRRSFGRVIAALVTGSFVCDLLVLHHQPSAAFYWPVTRFWELGLGCQLAWLQALRFADVHREAAPSRPLTLLRSGTRGGLGGLPAVAPVAGLGLILVSVFWLDSRAPAPGWPSLLATLGTTAILASPASGWLQERVLGSRLLVLAGLISYPLYLWHWPVLAFTSILSHGTMSVSASLIAISLSVALAALTYLIVERPVRTSSLGLRRSPAFACLLLLIGGSGLAVAAMGGFSERFAGPLRELGSGHRSDPGCARSVDSHASFNYCKRTDAAAPQGVFVGDSQAEALYDGTAATLGDDYSLLLLGRGGCPPVMNVQVPGIYPSDASRRACNDTWNEFVRYLWRTRPPVIVLAGAGSRFFDPQRAARTGTDPAVLRSAFEQGLEQLLRALPATSRVAYVSEIPEFEDGPSCYLRPIRLAGKPCSSLLARATLEANRSTYATSLQQVQARFPRLTVIDPIPALCNSRYCPQRLGSGELLYRDELHLSEAGGRRVARKSGLASLVEEAVSP